MRRPPRWVGWKVRCSGAVPPQSPRCRSTAASAVSGVDGAGDDDVDHVRRVVAGVEGAHVLDGERLDGLRAAGRQAPVRHAVREDLAKEALVGEAAGLGTSLEDVVQALGLDPIELAGVQSRGAHHLGEQGEALHRACCPSAVKPARALSHEDSLPNSMPSRSVVSANADASSRSGAGHQHLRGQPGERRRAPRPPMPRRHRSGGGCSPARVRAAGRARRRGRSSRR